MGAEARAISLEPASGETGVATPWTYFHATGTREDLTRSLDRLRARGWTISDQPALAGPFGTWDVVVHPPVR
jgi:hypothetical protein